MFQATIRPLQFTVSQVHFQNISLENTSGRVQPTSVFIWVHKMKKKIPRAQRVVFFSPANSQKPKETQ